MDVSQLLRTDSVEPLEGHREWIPSRDALGLVMKAYASHDFIDHDSAELKQRAAKASAAEAIIRRLTEGLLIARPKSFHFTQGCQESGTEHEFALHPERGTIDPNFWRTLQRLRNVATFDWIAGDFTFYESAGGIIAKGYACGVRFDLHNLPGLDRASVKSACNAGGAPRKWDWDGALAHLAALAHNDPDGLLRGDGQEPNQSDIAQHLRGWFIDQCDNAPEDSQLRAYGKRFVNALKELRIRDANKRLADR